ncbi:MAG: ABC transporter permease [Thermaceae bacterium]|nr:ABC transporter permease [Thermaceae bacterium]
MATYLAQRILQSVGVLWAVTVITFGLLYLLPADPARLVAGRSAPQEVVQRVRHELGLDRPLPLRYLGYLGGLARGDLGRSYTQKTRVSELLASRLVPTLELTLAGILFELLIGIPAGIIAALRRGSWLDQLVMLLSFTGVAAPQFVLGLLLLYLLAYKLALFPLGGYGGLDYLVLPALALGLAGGGWYARIMRSSMLEVLSQDYVRTARAKGLAGQVVVYKHALRNALLPIVAMIGSDLGTFMGGVVVVESVFGWPGIGQLTWQAIQTVDIPTILGAVTFTAFFIVLANLLADLVYPLLDPRVQYR